MLEHRLLNCEGMYQCYNFFITKDFLIYATYSILNSNVKEQSNGVNKDLSPMNIYTRMQAHNNLKPFL